MRWALLVLMATGSACGTPASSYEIRMHGAVEMTASGTTESGPAGTSEAPYYSITLGGTDGAAAAVFTRGGSTPPSIRDYPISEEALGRGGFSGLIITGQPSHPTGVFRVQRGTLSITALTPEVLSGRFELTAVGFLTEWPADDTKQLAATGRFTAQVAGRERSPALNLRLGQ